MESLVQLRIEMPEDSIFGHVSMVIGRMEDRNLVQSAWGYCEPSIAMTVPEGGPTHQWVIAVLRDITDRAIAHHLQEMAEGKEIALMDHVVH